MELIEPVTRYFLADPFRILYFLGGSGGLIYWVSLFVNRRRLKVRVLSERPEINERTRNLDILSTFDVENLGNQRAALTPTVQFTGYTYELQKQTETISIALEQRTLEPFSPVQLQFHVTGKYNYPFFFYRTYTFRLSRGQTRRLRLRDDKRKELGFIRFHIELLWFLGKRALEMKAMHKRKAARAKEAE